MRKTNLHRYFVPMIFAILIACDSDNKNIQGLWQLEEVTMDVIENPHEPTFIQINANKSFSISRRSGDLSGIYSIRSREIEMNSTDKDWFNNTWTFLRFEDRLTLKGKDFIYRNIKLKFKKIDKIPDFQEFENKIIGKWLLYKIKNKNTIEKLSNTWFIIDENKNYSIVDDEGPIETGSVDIDTRHKKIIFKNKGVTWNAWFYGEELRLNNKNLSVQYSLRKAK